MPARLHENLDAPAPSRIKEAGFARVILNGAGKTVVILNGAKRSEGFPVRQHGESSPDGFQNIGKSISCQHCAILHKILRFVQAFLRSRKCRQDKKCNHSNDVMQSLLSGTPVQKTNENNELPPPRIYQYCNYIQQYTVPMLQFYAVLQYRCNQTLHLCYKYTYSIPEYTTARQNLCVLSRFLFVDDPAHRAVLSLIKGQDRISRPLFHFPKQSRSASAAHSRKRERR